MPHNNKAFTRKPYLRHMQTPTFRAITKEAIQTLASEFSYPPNSPGWQYDVAQIKDIEKYFFTYHNTHDDDIRFLLMEMILQTSEETRSPDWISTYWPSVKLLLQSNFPLHAYTIFYWCVFQNENVEDCFYITASMRTLWQEQSGKYLLSSSS